VSSEDHRIDGGMRSGFTKGIEKLVRGWDKAEQSLRAELSYDVILMFFVYIVSMDKLLLVWISYC
jgi:hypothetical protein